MHFQATWDLETKAVTVGAMLVWAAATCVCVWAIIKTHDVPMKLVMAVASLPPLALVPLLALWSPIAYELDGSGLRILRRASAIEVPLGSIQSVQILDDQLRFRRDFGVGGLFGYFGHFSAPGLGKLTLYSSRVTGRVALKTSQGTIVVTPDTASGFVAELERLRAR